MKSQIQYKEYEKKELHKTNSVVCAFDEDQNITFATTSTSNRKDRKYEI
jgi:hypothetical protein